MKRKHVVYIHGLGSDANSRKFQLLKAVLNDSHSIECVEWKENDNISHILRDTAIRLIFLAKDVVIIGDSMGGNLAVQLRDALKGSRVNTSLVLLNPMLDISKRKINVPLAHTLLKHIQKIDAPINSLIILSDDDEIIDHSWLKKSTLEDVQIIEVKDTHRMMNFSEHILRFKQLVETD